MLLMSLLLTKRASGVQNVKPSISDVFLQLLCHAFAGGSYLQEVIHIL